MRPVFPFLIAVLAVAITAGGADAQMGPRNFGGGFGRGQFMHGGPFWRRGSFRQPPPRFVPPPPAPPGRYDGPPTARWRDQQELARQGVRGGQLAPLDRVISSIGRRTPGRQLDTGIEYQGERPVYRVRWITDRGRRVDYMVDAASGAILSER